MLVPDTTTMAETVTNIDVANWRMKDLNVEINYCFQK